MLKARTDEKISYCTSKERAKYGGLSAIGTHCTCLQSHWEDAKGKHEANQLTETFPVLVLSDEKKPKG